MNLALLALWPLSMVTLRDEYRPLCHRPAEYLGFSFAGTLEENAAMREAGANAVGMGAMWFPVEDKGAPYGCGVNVPIPAGVLGQSFLAHEEFDGFRPCLPTMVSRDSGCRWTLRLAESERSNQGKSLAEGAWAQVQDNSWPEAAFPPQLPGSYRFEISEATGTWIGWWARSGNPYPDGCASVGDRAQESVDFEFQLRSGGKWKVVVPASSDHQAMLLGPSPFQQLSGLGMGVAYSVGNWNNPGFPYYPDWFYERFPDCAEVDQIGQPILGGMFGKAVPSPGLGHPVIVDGTSRFIKATVTALRKQRNLLYWVMGGESMYGTYSFAERWTDYGPHALSQFRQWLQARRYQSVAELNRAWRTSYPSFENVEPPRQRDESQRWLDWLDFRFEAAAERFAWHYQAAREADPDRLILTCNHGTMYHDNTYAALGARFELHAAVSDGFETGQIMTDSDPDLYNLLYVDTISPLGKPYCPVRLAYKKSDPMARGGGTSYTPETARRYVYESLGADAWHLGLIQWSGSLPDGEWGVVGTPAEKEIRRLFGEIRQLAPYLEDMHCLKPRVAVYLSHPTWALRGFLPEWRALHRAMVEQHIPKAFVSDLQLTSGEAADYKVLLSLKNDLVAEEGRAALAEYKRRGGTVVTDPTDRVDDSCRPVKITSAGKARRPVEEETASQVDWPQDLFGHVGLTESPRSLGQTVALNHSGLLKVAICMPTYWKKPEVGFRFEARLNDPQGVLLARRDVPGGIGDNAWVDLDLPSSPTKGAVLYVSATPDPALKEEHLGWWSSHRDVYEGGQAYENGRPITGDRKVRLTYAESIPADRVVESFALSDGLNFGVILINTSADAISLGIDLTHLGSSSGKSQAYTVHAPLAPDTWKGHGLTGQTQLAANGTAFLYMQRKVTRRQVEAWLSEAANRVSEWREQKAITPFAEYALKKARQFRTESKLEKAAAMALEACGQLGLGVQADGRGDLEVLARVSDGSGKPVTGARVAAEFTPTCGYHRKMSADGRGVYRLRLSPRDLPPRYDYEAQRYVPFYGPLRIRVSARSGRLRASRWVDVVVPSGSQ